MTVGHVSLTLTDDMRVGRRLTTDVWYPTQQLDGDNSLYELLPGIAFESPTAVEGAAPARGSFPLVIWSHGRTGLRHNYTMLCEGLSARGYVVVSGDHPGDTLFDWLSGTNVDDETNERQRVCDVSFLIDQALGGLADSLPSIDSEAIFVGGHSYGGLTAIVSATGIHGLPPDRRVRAIAGAQAYTRTLDDAVVERLSVPGLLLVGTGDLTTPPATDADPIWHLMQSMDSRHRRIDLPHSGHQACSDFAYYMELLPTIPDVPQLVVDYLESIAAESPAGFRETWRDTIATQTTALADFFDVHR